METSVIKVGRGSVLRPVFNTRVGTEVGGRLSSRAHSG